MLIHMCVLLRMLAAMLAAISDYGMVDEPFTSSYF